MKNKVTLMYVALSIGMSLINTLDSSAKSSVAQKIQDSLSSEKFVKEAMLYGMKAYQTSGLASNKSSNKRVKSLAEMMVANNFAANNDLRALATKMKITLPMSKPGGGLRPDGRIDPTPDNLKDTSRNQNMGEAGNDGKMAKDHGQGEIREESILEDVNILKKLNGNDFNKKYLQMMIDDHKKSIVLFEKGSSVKDPAVSAFATKYLSSLKKQLDTAEALMAKLN